MESFAGYVLLFSASVAASIINSVAGGGSLISFPALVAMGQPAIIANATNTAGIWPGSLSSALAYRRDTDVNRSVLIALLIPSIIGGLSGAVVLVYTPPELFDKIVPFLVLFATVIFAFRDFFSRVFSRGKTEDEKVGLSGKVWGFFFQLFVATYGGYFGAGIGILMLGSLSVMGFKDIHKMNAVKTILGTLINIIAFIFFSIKGLVVWPLALIMAAGTILGGYLGARTAKKIDQKYIRIFVIFTGFAVSFWFFFK